jgi:kynureninase
MMTAKQGFSRALGADPERVHFAAHSHHLWPDVTFDAHMQAWLDAATLADRKWESVFGSLLPRAQAHVARVLALPDPTTLAFAPNTHELVTRILSALPNKPPRILTTDGEFHSFSRQCRRLEESGDAFVTRIPVEPTHSFVERFCEAARSGSFDLVFTSHVFFGSGWAIPALTDIVAAVRDRESFVVIDGYHGFMALPATLDPIADRTFYVAGGYKYAMSGEGACFLHAPKDYGPRPSYTGWFAAFGALSSGSAGGVEYAPSGARYLGATFDPTGLYRFVAAMDWLEREGITPSSIHAHVHALQARFAEALDCASLPFSTRELVVPITEPSRGHFLTFETTRARELYERLLAANIVTDVRGDRLRIGFGLYHDEDDIDRGLRRIADALG